MSYTTSFEGQFLLDRRLTEVHRAYLKQFGETRRMKRDAAKLATIPDPVREAAGLPLGPEGAYFVGGEGFGGQDDHPSILAYNEPPQGQPSLWCHWIPNDRGTHILYSGDEKFYYYIDWLEYLIAHFLVPWGYFLNGEVTWEGEEEEEGLIRVHDNQVEVITTETEEDGPISPEEIEMVVGLFRSRKVADIRKAGSLAAYYDQHIPGAAEALMAHLKDPVMEVRWSAIEELTALGDASEPAIPLLIEALKDPHEWVRSAAAAALGELGARAAAAIPALESLRDDVSYGPRGRSLQALEVIRGEVDG